MIGGIGTAPLGVIPLGMTGGGGYSEESPVAALIANPLATRTWLLRATVTDRATGDPTVIRLGSRGYWSRPSDGSPREIFRPGLVTPYNWSVDLLRAGRLTKGVAGSRADIQVANDGTLDYLLRDVLWRRGDLETLLGDGRPRSGSALAAFGRVQRASAAGVSSSTDTISIKQRDSSELLKVPLQQTRYKGLGQALRLDGSDDLLTVGDHLSIAADQDFFFAIRGKFPASRQGMNEYLVRRQQSASDQGYRMNLNLDDQLVWNVHGTSDIAEVRPDVLAYRDDGEHLFVGILERGASGDSIRVYADGKLLDSETTTTAMGVVGSVYGFQLSTPGAPWGGDLIEAAVGYRVPTEAELAAWVNRPLDADQDDCAVWRLNEGTGSTAFAAAAQSVIDADSSITQASDLDATITGAVWVGSLEGDATLAGKSKPSWFGTVEEVEAHLVDPVANVYQVHDPASGGWIWEWTEIRDSGLGTSDAGGWAVLGDTSDVYSVSPAQGELYTDTSRCLIRFGGNGPAGRVTVSLKVSVDQASYVADRWSIARYLATNNAGLAAATQVNAGSFGDASDRAYEAGVGGGLESRTVADAIAELCYPDCKAYMDRQAKLSVFALRDPATVSYDRTYTARDLERGASERLYSVEPADRVSVRWGRRYTPQKAGELADALTPAQKAELGEEWRLAWSGEAQATDEITVESALVHQADAQEVAELLHSVYGVLREAFRLSVPAELYQVYLGDGLATDWERFGLDVDHSGSAGPRPHLVTGGTEVVSRGRQTVHVVTLT